MRADYAAHRAAKDPATAPRAWRRHRRRRRPDFPSTRGHSAATAADVQQQAVIGSSPLHRSWAAISCNGGGPASPWSEGTTHGSEKSSRKRGNLFATLALANSMEGLEKREFLEATGT